MSSNTLLVTAAKIALKEEANEARPISGTTRDIVANRLALLKRHSAGYCYFCILPEGWYE